MVRIVIFCVAGLMANTALGQSNKAKNVESASEHAAVIQAVREYALAYSEHLPDYTCTQITHEGSIPPNAVNNPNVEATVIEEEIGYVSRQEVRKLLRVDGRPANAGTNKRAGMSQGEFAYLLNIIFEPATGADLRWEREEKLNGGKVDVVAFHVPEARGYVLKQSRGSMRVPFEGFVYADAQTHAVLRIQLKCTMIPANSEIRNLDLTLDYKATSVAGQEFILPSRFVLRFLDGRQHMNEGTFTAYRRFTANADIHFDGDKQQ